MLLFEYDHIRGAGRSQIVRNGRTYASLSMCWQRYPQYRGYSSGPTRNNKDNSRVVTMPALSSLVAPHIAVPPVTTMLGSIWLAVFMEFEKLTGTVEQTRQIWHWQESEQKPEWPTSRRSSSVTSRLTDMTAQLLSDVQSSSSFVSLFHGLTSKAL